jgi:epoxyqueuosine reductase QueG
MNLKKNIISEIQHYVIEKNNPKEYYRLPIVKFASAQDPLFNKLKEIVDETHLLPKDILSDAVTVISYFIPFSYDVIESNRISDEVSFKWGDTYNDCNQLLFDLGLHLTNYLANFNIKVGTYTKGYKDGCLFTGWSQKSVAYIAGMGTFGLNHTLITDAGCAGRFGSIVINADIAPDALQINDKCLYKQGNNCSYCIDHCPISALTLTTLDKDLCYRRTMEVSNSFDFESLCDVCGKCTLGPCAIYKHY